MKNIIFVIIVVFFLLPLGLHFLSVVMTPLFAPDDIDGITQQEKTCANELVGQHYDFSKGYIFKKSVENREGKALSIGIYTWFGKKLSTMKVICDGGNEQILSIQAEN